MGNERPMQDADPAFLVPALQLLIDDLARGNLDAIISRREHGILTEDELELACREYPGAINAQVVDPARVWLYEYVGRAGSGMVEYDLMVDGVISDLTLTCEYDTARDPLLTIEQLHVL